MFPYEIKQEILTKFVQGVSISKLMKAYHIKGPAIIYHWYERFKLFEIQDLMNSSKKTSYDYSFKIKVIKWRQEQQASYPVTAKRFKIKNPVAVWDWEK
ncbi:helix-turn-helix domain-containing protein [Lactiplantibacillus sp. DA1]|uniref:helix-turn-helix domain-containing protein n=1 Tax=Lactiplantibacillus sp. DA1 TaxID=3079857 RepID=UPI00292A6273|nr:helix-turn-helix domain-containing protein [Lactiplantibacillus sp. DA1]MDV0431165.1 helix-turn-helix domain-containing protein [Lactiplantibacillus sp. DA1]